MKKALPVVLSLVVLFTSAAPSGEDALRPPGDQPQGVTPQQAVAMIVEAAEQGNQVAMLNLGSMYERGIGVPRNYTKAFEWYGKAAATGMPEGFYNLGVCYEIGMGVAADGTKAFEYFERAASTGLSQALYKLASLYFAGIGVEKNESWGVELLKRAAGSGHQNAANDLGVIFHEGAFGQARDPNQAFAMFSAAAELGNAGAMKNLAVLHREGFSGQAADPAQAMKWYSLAKLAGYPPAAIDPLITELRTGLGDARAAEIDKEVEAWALDFQRRNAEANQNQPAQN
ncbi:MAG: sel1 repeat family protein [Planctomycetota bacterium]|jgi:TPR repeat protein|nr:sel1 repeat family protein [Planctomycetota bacterium]